MKIIKKFTKSRLEKNVIQAAKAWNSSFKHYSDWADAESRLGEAVDKLVKFEENEE